MKSTTSKSKKSKPGTGSHQITAQVIPSLTDNTAET